MPVWVQWLATLIGITFLWLAIFVTPSEHKLFSDILEEWWFRVETLRERGLSTVGAILVLVAEKFGSVGLSLPTQLHHQSDFLLCQLHYVSFVSLLSSLFFITKPA